MNFCESKTKENLARAFISEVVDGARYQFMAKDAKSKGFGFLNKTFKQLATNEMAHARVFYDFILNEGKSDCKCNGEGCENIDVSVGLPYPNYMIPDSLKISSVIEKHESAKIYKEFEIIASEEGFEDVAKAFGHVVQVENCHHLQLKELSEKMQQDKLYKMPKINKWKCTNCGTEIEGKQAPSPCPFCKYPQGFYMVPLSE